MAYRKPPDLSLGHIWLMGLRWQFAGKVLSLESQGGGGAIAWAGTRPIQPMQSHWAESSCRATGHTPLGHISTKWQMLLEPPCLSICLSISMQKNPGIDELRGVESVKCSSLVFHLIGYREKSQAKVTVVEMRSLICVICGLFTDL